MNQFDIKEEARLHAERSMNNLSWDRKDDILIGIFYAHMLDYIFDNYKLEPKQTF